MCFSNAKTYSLDFRGITLSGANGGNDDSSQPFGTSSVGSNSTNLDTGFGSSRRGGAPTTAAGNKRTRVSFLLYWVTKLPSGCNLPGWEVSRVFPVCLYCLPVPPLRLKLNQNVINKQQPSSFLSNTTSPRALLGKASHLAPSHHVLNARLLSPEHESRPININRRKVLRRSEFWQEGKWTSTGDALSRDLSLLLSSLLVLPSSGWREEYFTERCVPTISKFLLQNM